MNKNYRQRSSHPSIEELKHIKSDVWMALKALKSGDEGKAIQYLEDVEEDLEEFCEELEQFHEEHMSGEGKHYSNPMGYAPQTPRNDSYPDIYGNYGYQNFWWPFLYSESGRGGRGGSSPQNRRGGRGRTSNEMDANIYNRRGGR